MPAAFTRSRWPRAFKRTAHALRRSVQGVMDNYQYWKDAQEQSVRRGTQGLKP